MSILSHDGIIRPHGSKLQEMVTEHIVPPIIVWGNVPPPNNWSTGDRTLYLVVVGVELFKKCVRIYQNISVSRRNITTSLQIRLCIQNVLSLSGSALQSPRDGWATRPPTCRNAGNRRPPPVLSQVYLSVTRPPRCRSCWSGCRRTVHRRCRSRRPWRQRRRSGE